MKIDSERFTPQLIEKVQKLFERNKAIIAAYFFGSMINEKARADSDLDLAVIVSDRSKCQELDLLPEISQISFPAEIDLSVVDLTASPLFLYQIIKNGLCIYEKTKKERFEFEADTLQIYYDTQHMRNIYHTYLNKFIKEDTYGRR